MAGWIETKFNKILTHWEGFLDTDYDKEPKKETPAKKATPGTKKVESPAEAEKPTRGGRRNAPGGSGDGGMFEMSVPAKEHIGRRGWMQCPNGAYLLKSGSKMFKRNIRFIKAAPNGQDMDPPNITQAIKGENDCRPKVQGSSPTDGPMTRSRMK